jgi:hypothetical protein
VRPLWRYFPFNTREEGAAVLLGAVPEEVLDGRPRTGAAENEDRQAGTESGGAGETFYNLTLEN